MYFYLIQILNYRMLHWIAQVPASHMGFLCVHLVHFYLRLVIRRPLKIYFNDTAMSTRYSLNFEINNK